MQKCSDCRRECREIEASLENFRNLAQQDPGVDWSDAEWKKLMAGAVSQKIEGRQAVRAPSLKPVLVYGLALVVFLAIVGLVLRNTLLKSIRAPFTPTPVLVQKTVTPDKPFLPEQKDKNKDTSVRPGDKPIIIARVPDTRRPAIHPREPAAARKEGSQDVVSVRLVSQDTGLQVIWFLDKNFEWKGERK